MVEGLEHRWAFLVKRGRDARYWVSSKLIKLCGGGG